jgi:hypothetical protein
VFSLKIDFKAGFAYRCIAKEYVFALGQLAISGHSQHPSHGSAGIYRVQQNALCCSDLFHRVYCQRAPLP